MEHTTLRELKAMASKPISAWGTDGGDPEKIYRQNQYITALEEDRERLRDALKPVGEALLIHGLTAKNAAHHTYNPDAHGPELTLTIAEIRAIWAALEEKK